MKTDAKLKTIVGQALDKLGLPLVAEMTIEHPADPDHGDFSSNVAMQLFGLLKDNKSSHAYSNPRELANALADQIDQIAQNEGFLDSVSVAGPGFINFALSSSFLLGEMQRINKNPTQDLQLTSKKTAVIEYVSPNTNKPLHIGHLRNAVLGYSLIGILEEIGWDVHKAIINNDRGLHIVKSMWAYLVMGQKPLANIDGPDLLKNLVWQETLQAWLNNPQNWIVPAEMTEKKLQKPDHFVGYWYVKADALAEEQSVLKMWQEMLVAWEDKNHPDHLSVRKLWQQLNKWFYQGYDQTRDRVGFVFDPEHVSYESQIFEAGKQIVLEGAKNKVFEVLENGAVQAVLEEKYNLPNKILLRGDGTGIYMTFDIELTRRRSKLGADLLVWVVGSDQKLYFQQLFAVCELLGFGKRENFRHFGYGMVRLPEGKMSSRKGRVIYADDILDMAVEKAMEIMKQTGAAAEFSTSQLRKTAEIVGLGAIKWTMLSQDPLSNMTFDLDSSVSFTGFAGPYVQYTAVRSKSVLAKAQPTGQADFTDLKFEPEERAVLRQIYQYPEVIHKAGQDFAPHQICTYLFDLSREYSAFYNRHQIIIEKDPQTQEFRLQLTQTVAEILSNGLHMLGIQLPAKM